MKNSVPALSNLLGAMASAVGMSEMEFLDNEISKVLCGGDSSLLMKVRAAALAAGLNGVVAKIDTVLVGSQSAAHHVLYVGPDRLYTTIQAALDAIGNAASVADLKQPKVVMIAPGIYDEALTIPRGRILTLCAEGTVILGNGLGTNFGSTNSRSITVNWYSADVFGSDVKPALNITVLGGSDATSTFIAEAGMFSISGGIVLNGDGLTATLNTSNVKLNGTLQHLSAGLCNWQSYRSLFVGAVTTTGNLVLERCHDSRFNALLSVNAVNMAANSNFLGGVTVQSVQQNMLPNGLFHCNVAGTWTGPASSLRIDGSTNYYFKANSGVLAGGATKVILHDAT